MENLKTVLKTMLNSGFEITNTNQTQFPITIMTPFVDNLGDNLVIYLEVKPHQYRFTDGGYLYDDLTLNPTKTIKAQLKTVFDFYGTKLDHDDLVSNWFDQRDVIDNLNFYPYLQSIIEAMAISNQIERS